MALTILFHSSFLAPNFIEKGERAPESSTAKRTKIFGSHLNLAICSTASTESTVVKPILYFNESFISLFDFIVFAYIISFVLYPELIANFISFGEAQSIFTFFVSFNHFIILGSGLDLAA